jgi:hypothetical protein
VNEAGPGDRSCLGGESEFTALMSVVREIPKRYAMRAFGTPSAATSLLINAQSSPVITLQSLSAHFHRRNFSASSAADSSNIFDPPRTEFRRFSGERDQGQTAAGHRAAQIPGR